TNGYSYLQSGVHVVNNGTTTVGGGWAAYWMGGSTLTNNKTVTLSDGASLQAGDGDPGNVFTNGSGATLSYAGSAGASAYDSVPSVNNGTVTASGGTLTLGA